jgi:hypothetical protein
MSVIRCKVKTFLFADRLPIEPPEVKKPLFSSHASVFHALV